MSAAAGSSTRPEHVAPPEIFYNDVEAKKYAMNSRMIEIQTAMSERAIELLNIPKGQSAYILDIGCGSGLSGEALEEHGFQWTGVDIAPAMLSVAREREVEGDLICGDIGQGLPFRANTFDGAISISVVQWLCNADMASHQPKSRLKAFFVSLYTCLRRGSRAILQFYPESPSSMALITEAAMKAGFNGGLVVDYPQSTRAKKYFLCLCAGEASSYQIPKALEGDDSNDASIKSRHTIAVTRSVSKKSKSSRSNKHRPAVKSVEWIKAKKERQRAQGKEVTRDSKYTGRKRGPKF